MVPRRSTVSTWIIPSSVIMIEITAQEPKKKRAAAAAATYFSWQIWSRPLPHLHRAPPVSHPPMLPCRGRLRRVPLGGIQDRPGGVSCSSATQHNARLARLARQARRSWHWHLVLAGYTTENEPGVCAASAAPTSDARPPPGPPSPKNLADRHGGEELVGEQEQGKIWMRRGNTHKHSHSRASEPQRNGQGLSRSRAPKTWQHDQPPRPHSVIVSHLHRQFVAARRPSRSYSSPVPSHPQHRMDPPPSRVSCRVHAHCCSP